MMFLLYKVVSNEYSNNILQGQQVFHACLTQYSGVKIDYLVEKKNYPGGKKNYLVEKKNYLVKKNNYLGEKKDYPGEKVSYLDGK